MHKFLVTIRKSDAMAMALAETPQNWNQETQEWEDIPGAFEKTLAECAGKIRFSVKIVHGGQQIAFKTERMPEDIDSKRGTEILKAHIDQIAIGRVGDEPYELEMVH